jgi:hypothetical protein
VRSAFGVTETPEERLANLQREMDMIKAKKEGSAPSAPSTAESDPKPAKRKGALARRLGKSRTGRFASMETVPMPELPSTEFTHDELLRAEGVTADYAMIGGAFFKNSFMVKVDGHVAGKAFSPCPSTIVFPFHFIEAAGDEARVTFERICVDGQSLTVSVSSIIDTISMLGGHDDLCLFVNIDLPRTRDLRSKLITRGELQELATLENIHKVVSFDPAPLGNSPKTVRFMEVAVAKVGSTVRSYVGPDTEWELKPGRYLEFGQGASYSGACGNQAFVRLARGLILGFVHVAGTGASSTCYSQALVYEDVVSALKDHPENIFTQRRVMSECVRLDGPEVVSNMPVIGLTDPVPMPTKTKKFKSTLHGAFGPLPLAPAKLGRDHGESVLLRRIQKSTQHRFHMKQATVDTHAKFRAQQLRSAGCIPTFKGMVTPEEAVLGVVKGIKRMGAIPRSTSMGHPTYARLKKAGLATSTTKKEVFGYDDEYNLDNPAWLNVKGQVLKIIEDIDKGGCPDLHYTLMTKDELVSLEKAEKGDTRVITNSPLELQIIMRMCMMAGMEALIKEGTAGPSGHFVGADPKKEWHGLRLHLQELHSHFCLMDIKGCDRSLSPQMIGHFFDVLDRIDPPVTKLQAKVRAWVRAVVCHPTFNAEGQLLQSCGYNPSGILPTVEINGESVILIMDVCIAQLMDPFYDPMVDVFTDWGLLDRRIVMHGDDFALALSHDMWTNADMARAALKIGITITNVDKSDPLVDDRKFVTDLSETSFLKRSFVEDRGWTFAPLELDSIRKAAYWRTNKDDETFIMTLQDQLDECVEHKWKDVKVIVETISAALRDTYGREPDIGNEAEHRRARDERRA